MSVIKHSTRYLIRCTDAGECIEVLRYLRESLGYTHNGWPDINNTLEAIRSHFRAPKVLYLDTDVDRRLVGFEVHGSSSLYTTTAREYMDKAEYNEH